MNGIIKIWLMFAIYLVLFALVTYGNLRIGTSATQTMWFMLSVGVLLISIAMLVKYRLPSKKQIVISAIFGILMFVPFVSMVGITALFAVRVPLVTFLSAMAFFSISNHYPENSIVLLKDRSVKSVVISILIGILVGMVWGTINIFLNSDQPSPHFALINLIMPLNPGVYEEMAFRAFIFASCLHFMNGELTTKRQRFTAWFMMIIPHVLPHTPNMFIEQGFVSGILSIVILSAVFGVPLAFLQRKRDLVSAMIAHGVVMIMFFTMFGISLP